MTGLLTLYVTCADKNEALKIAHALVEKRLAACANVMDGLTSVYRWEGKLHEAPEAALFAKTSQAKLAAAQAEVKRLHSYDVPCIIAYPIASGYPPFLQWIEEETGG